MPDVDRCVTKILGIDFFHGTAREAVERMRRRGGLLVVPAAPALKDLDTRADYREALISADMALTDSAFMVLIWNWLQRNKIRRLSGLEYLRELLRHEDVRQPRSTLWVMAGAESARCNLEWLHGEGVTIPEDCVYLAPMYGRDVQDQALLERLEALKVRHVIITIGGGTQERLGLYLRRNLTYVPSIHCIGAAIAFLSGDQVHIPMWADRFYMGWLFRTISEPKRYLPRYWDARKLFRLMVRYRDQLPDLVPAER